MFRMKNYADFIATPPPFCQSLKRLKTDEVSPRDLVRTDHRLLRKSFARWRRQFSRLLERSKEKFSSSTENDSRFASHSACQLAWSLSRSARADSYVSVVSSTTSGVRNFTYKTASGILCACHFRPGRNIKPERWVACGRKLRVGAATGCNLMHDILKYPFLARKGGETSIEYRFYGKLLAVQITRRHASIH